MPSLENIKCPVCKAEFGEGDDVVYCPECGTPHHRACYNMIGHCVNKGLHESGYRFFEPAAKEEKKSDEGDKTFFIPAQKTDNENEEVPALPFQSAAPDFLKKYESEKIGEDNGADVAATIRTSIERFMALFRKFDKKEKSISWNWGAFFFGPYYLLYRKVYSHGIAFLCLQTALSYLGSYLLSVKAPKFTEAYSNIMNSMSSLGSVSSISSIDQSTLTGAADYGVAQKILFAMIAASVIIRVIIALFADKIYFGSVKNIIRTVNEKIENGATFNTTSVFGPMPQNLDSTQMRRMYLSRRGGTSFMAPLGAYLVINLIMSLL